MQDGPTRISPFPWFVRFCPELVGINKRMTAAMTSSLGSRKPQKMMTFPEIRLGKARPHTDRVKARAGARRHRMTSRLEVLEERTLLSFTGISTTSSTLAQIAAYRAATTVIQPPAS